MSNNTPEAVASNDQLGASHKAKPTANLEWSLYVHCPECDEVNDLASPDHDGEHSIASAIFTNAWDRLDGWEVTCGHCMHEFTIERVEY